MQDIRLKNLLIVWVLLTIFHFGLHSAAIQGKLMAHANLEMRRVEDAIYDRVPDPDSMRETRVEYHWQDYIDRVFSFPLLIFLKESKPGEEAYASLTVSAWWRIGNSMLAALVLHAFLFCGAPLLSPSHRLRKFIEGRDLREREGLPKELDSVPLFATARQLEKIEGTRYGPILVVGFLHLLLTGVSRLLEIASNMNGQPIPLFPVVMQLPLTPLIVPRSFWTAVHHNDAVKKIVLMANSLISAILIIVVYQTLKKVFVSNKPS